MKYTVETKGAELTIDVQNVGDKKQWLLQSLQECTEGRCSCSTPEYEKLDAIDVQPGEDTVRIVLKSKPGKVIDQAAIDTCMEHKIRDQELS